MPSVNPGPASTSTQNSVAVITPVNAITGPTGTFQGADAMRLLGSARAVGVTQAGDVPVPIINSSRYTVNYVVYATSAGVGSTAAAYVTAAYWSIYTATAAGGTNIVASASYSALSNTTGVAYAAIVGASSTASNTASTIYVRVGTTVASTTGGTFDAFIYGYDLS
jgi:hypothetical protein